MKTAGWQTDPFQTSSFFDPVISQAVYRVYAVWKIAASKGVAAASKVHGAIKGKTRRGESVRQKLSNQLGKIYLRICYGCINSLLKCWNPIFTQVDNGFTDTEISSLVVREPLRHRYEVGILVSFQSRPYRIKKGSCHQAPETTSANAASANP